MGNTWGNSPAMSAHGRPRRDRILGQLDPHVGTLARWADEHPEAMRRLLTDPEMQRLLLAALDDVVGPADEGEQVAGAG